MKRRQLLGVLLALPGASARAADERTGTWVAATRRGPVFSIDAVIVVPVTPRVAWDVLSDFDAWPTFVPGMASSRVVAREGTLVRIEQRGELKWGPAMHPYTTVRDVQLTPFESMRSTSIEGAAPREQSVTRFKEVAAGAEIWHHAEMAFENWMPDWLAESFLQNVMQERYDAMAAEMVRRNATSQR